MLTTVYFFPVDASGQESGESFSITLENSHASLSNLPQSIRESLETFGAPNETRTERLFPKDGERFLNALLRMTGQQYRFRSSR